MRKVICFTEKDNFGDGGICWCCRRRSEGIGHYYGASNNQHIVWSCYDHIRLAKKATNMSQKEYDFYENKSLDAAGEAAGQYLDKIGKTDLASLELHEWRKFCQTMIDAFGDDLAKRVSSHEAPF